MSSAAATAVTSDPAISAATKVSRCETAPGMASTNSPPWGAWSSTPPAIEIAPATAEPSAIAGITRVGSFAANGIAPSVMKASPSTAAAFAASRSSRVNRFRRRTVASASPSGGVIPATIVAAIGVKVLLASSPTENA